MSLHIKRLEKGDEKIAAQTVRELKAERVNYSYLHGFLKSKTNVLFVALDGDTPVGFLLAYELERIDSPKPMMLLYEVEVAEAYRRQGIASTMIQGLKEICRERGILKMWVLTNEANRAAMRTYESTGGKQVDDDDLVMFLYIPEDFSS